MEATKSGSGKTYQARPAVKTTSRLSRNFSQPGAHKHCVGDDRESPRQVRTATPALQKFPTPFLKRIMLNPPTLPHFSAAVMLNS
jgi:hypothetical protein